MNNNINHFKVYIKLGKIKKSEIQEVTEESKMDSITSLEILFPDIVINEEKNNILYR